MDPRVGYCTPFFIAAILIFIAALFVYQRRRVRGAWYLTILCLAASVWAATEGMLYLGLDIESNMFITKLQYLGIVPLPPLALLFVISFFGFESWITRTRILLLSIIAMTVIILVWTNSLHHLVFSGYYTIDTGPFQMLGLKHGLLWWVIIVYHYFLLAMLSTILISQVFNSAGLHRYQAGVFLAAVAMVWIGNAVYVSGHSPVPNMDISPLAFTLVAASMAWGFFRYSLLDILPVAKAEIFHGLDDAILVLDDKERIIDMNPAAESMFNMNVTEIIGKDSRRVFPSYPQLHELPSGSKQDEVCLNTAGHESVYDIHVSELSDKKGTRLGCVIALRNITERKQAEEALRESEERYRRLVEQSLQGLIIAQDNPMRLSFVSKPMENITGYSQEELTNFGPPQLMQLIHPEERETFFKNFKDRLSGKDVPPVYESRAIHKTKGTRWVEIYSSLIEYKGAPATQTVFLDITERKLAEQALRESEAKLARSKKMESLGLLAGGVAHDLNNVLSGIVSYPQLLLMDLPEDSELRKPIETIQASGHRATAIVQDLLTVAKGVATSKKPLNLNDLIRDYLNSPEFNKLEQFHPTVTVKTNLDKGLLAMEGSYVHIRKVVMNLVSNAAEAIDGRGNINITTMNRYMDKPWQGYDNINIGEYVVLSVTDDGSGISPYDLERIFEPFYTKKIMGRSGTGLGLAVVWNVVRDHKGCIDVISAKKGTTFELYFPIARGEMAVEDLSMPLQDYQGKKETILVVDDVESQREISCKILDTLGYQATDVSSGEAAVEYVRYHPVDLVLLDMIMDPGINGRETYARIIKIHPRQKAVIVSGFAETEEVKKAQSLGAGKFLKKPLTLEKLGPAIKKELEK
jgi:PAS domain S-box-containing protein